MKKSKLRAKAENLIRAEAAFRFGPIAYTRQAQELLLRAERQFRRAVTGDGRLYEAGELLGAIVVNDEPAARPMKTAKKKRKCRRIKNKREPRLFD